MRATVLASVVLFAVSVASAADPAAVPKECLQKLSRGLNLSMWWAQMPPDDKRFKGHVTAEDAARIKQLGCTFVRLPVDPQALTDLSKSGAMKADRLKLFEKSLDLFQEQGVAVLVCPYLDDDAKVRVMTDPKWRANFAVFLRTLAEKLSTRPVDMIFLEVLNEPACNDQSIVDGFLKEMMPELRKGAPKHTLVVPSNLRANNRMDTVGGFANGKTVADANAIYDLHFYDPVTFTHQGATWMPWQCKFIKNLPYPSSLELIRPVLKDYPSQGAKDWAVKYGQEQWNKDRIDAALQRAIDWGAKNKATILCGEFGCFGDYCPPEARAKYLRDVRETLEKHSLGWAMWEYCGGFGVVQEKDGKRFIDDKVCEALGLSAPAAQSQPASSGS